MVLVIELTMFLPVYLEIHFKVKVCNWAHERMEISYISIQLTAYIYINGKLKVNLSLSKNVRQHECYLSL